MFKVGKNTVGKLKSKAHLFSLRYKTLRLLKQYKCLPGEKYEFSKSDINLYITERTCKLYPLEIVKKEGTQTLLRINGIDFYWPNQIPCADSPWLYHEVFDPWKNNPSSYDHPLFDRSAARWIIDAGAFEGFYSLFAMQGFDGKILAIEPLKIMRDSLERSLSLAGNDSFEIITKALGRECGHCAIVLDQSHACNSKTNNMELVDKNNSLSVEQTTIDKLISDYNLYGNGIIKMDIEGSEMDALKGAEKTIKELKPQLAIAIYHGYENAKECARILQSLRDDYQIEYRGMYAWYYPLRPYLMFAY